MASFSDAPQAATRIVIASAAANRIVFDFGSRVIAGNATGASWALRPRRHPICMVTHTPPDPQ
ncbi:MAG: hypothetical protein ACI9OJ_004134, partial [Myxococcota bacterium]